MSIAIQSAGRAIKSLIAPGVPTLVAISALMALLAIMGIAGGSGMLTSYLMADAAAEHSGLVGWLLGTVGGVLLVGILFPLLMPVIVSFFDEAIADRIEKQEFPALAIGTSQPWLPELLADLRFTFKAILLNILALPTLLIPPLYPVVYYVLNGYLLGTQFFMMAGGRHIGKANARALASKHRGTIITAGLVIVFCSHIPLLNLIAPVWGVAVMVHVFQALYPQPKVLPAV